MKQCVVAVFVLLGFASFNTNAALISYTGAGNVGLVYSSVSDITWTQDANLFKTLYDADNTLIDQIAAFTPINFDTSKGRMSWWGGIAFTNYLNIINYAAAATNGACRVVVAVIRTMVITQRAVNWGSCITANWAR